MKKVRTMELLQKLVKIMDACREALGDEVILETIADILCQDQFGVFLLKKFEKYESDMDSVLQEIGS